jgi:hypothetical protein
MASRDGCEHRFVESEAGLFAGTQAARFCEICEHVEVLVEGNWIEFQAYLHKRRSERPPPMA